MYYSEKFREKKLTELKQDKNFMEFACKEFKERKMIKGIFRFRNNFEDDLKDNLEHYTDMWEQENFFKKFLKLGDKTQDKIIEKALADLEDEFNFS